MADITETLAERGPRHGRFTEHAMYTQQLKFILHSSPKWEGMAYDLRESLEMIVHKIGRILAGDPTFSDHWHDIAGYAKLIDDRLASAVRAVR